jgi:(4S)-4-hydroxy-5-phosphonooxypentane-2,3-dione isomerase
VATAVLLLVQAAAQSWHRMNGEGVVYVVVVEFQLHSGCLERFMPLMVRNAALSLELEPHCHQFDVCQTAANGAEVLLYEVYEDKSAFDAHLAMPHFRDFDSAVTSMIARKSVRTYNKVAQ